VAEAQQILEDKKLKAVTKPERSNEPEGTVLRQDPAPGAKLEENDEVTLVISARAPVGIPVPNLVGLTLADATAKVKAAGLNLNSAGAPTSIVVSQDPRPNPGLRVAPGTSITVVVRP
jgi:serine/threonine-protein kinase